MKLLFDKVYLFNLMSYPHVCSFFLPNQKYEIELLLLNKNLKLTFFYTSGEINELFMMSSPGCKQLSLIIGILWLGANPKFGPYRHNWADCLILIIARLVSINRAALITIPITSQFCYIENWNTTFVLFFRNFGTIFFYSC